LQFLFRACNKQTNKQKLSLGYNNQDCNTTNLVIRGAGGLKDWMKEKRISYDEAYLVSNKIKNRTLYWNLMRN
jgi:hypothetical protein